MDLTGAVESELCYCLVDTPDTIIEGLKRRFMWDAGIKGEDKFNHEAFEMIEKLSKYGDIPMEDRVHSILIPRDQDAINRLHERVIQCREYMNANF